MRRVPGIVPAPLAAAAIATCITVASGVAEPAVQRLVPWHSAGDHAVREDLTTAYMNARPPRLVRSLARNWTFNYLWGLAIDPAPAAPAFDDSEWPAVAIPHCWQNYETTRQLHPYMRYPLNYGLRRGVNTSYWFDGWGWYRKRFTVTAPLDGKRVFLEFEGAMKYTKVYINGTYLGENRGAFNAFTFDITDHVKTGQPNVLAVAVQNLPNGEERIPPMYSGNQVYSGGLYREVYLVVKNAVYIPFQGTWRHQGGTYVTTGVDGSVTVRTWIKNDRATGQTVSLRTTVLDPAGKTVSRHETRATIEPGVIQKVVQDMPRVANPARWSPETPDVYKVVSEVRVDGQVMDRFESPTGFRTFEWDYENNRAILNGKRIHIHGTNRCADFPWLNQAQPRWIFEQDMRDIKFGLDHNFIRFTVIREHPFLYDLCDQWGVLVNLCSPNIKSIDFDETVQERTMRASIRRHRNRPGIVFYSIGNETTDGANSNWIYEEDPTRIITARHVSGEGQGDHVQHTHENLNMEHMLRITPRGWTHDDVMPNRRPVNGQHASTEEWQHIRVRDITVKDSPERIDFNSVVWLYHDSSAARKYKNCPLKNINPKGWVDSYRIPKYVYFLWQAHYYQDDMIFIHPHYWREKYVGQTRGIVVDSNCEAVELFVNGKSHGVKHPNAEGFFTVTYDLPVERGEILVRGTRQGRTLERVLPMAEPPARLNLVASRRSFEAARDSLVYLTLDVQDRHGVQVQGFSEPLQWFVKGPAKLVGPATWKTDINKNLADEGAWYIVTPVCNLVRSTGEPGEVVVRVESEGLAAAEIRLDATPAPGVADGWVEEPPLFNVDRRPVDWRAAYDVPADMQPEKEIVIFPYYENIRLERDRAVNHYAGKLERIVSAHAPALNTEYPGVFKAFVAALADACLSHNGTLIADDFNFLGDAVNDCVTAIKAAREGDEGAESESAIIARFLEQPDGERQDAAREE